MKCSMEALASAKSLLDDAVQRHPEIDAAVPAARAALDEVAECACTCPRPGLPSGAVTAATMAAAIDYATANPCVQVRVEGQQ